MPSLKQKYRKIYLSLRSSLSWREREAKSAQICQKLLALASWQRAQTVMLYAAFKNEVETADLIQVALDQKKNVLLPRIEGGKGIVPYQIKAFPDDVAPGYAGILEPHSKTSPWRDAIDLIVLPGIAFDMEGGRLGYGKGCYDRFLKQMSLSSFKIGLTFEICLVTSLPLEDHDEKVDVIITEKRIVTPHTKLHSK